MSKATDVMMQRRKLPPGEPWEGPCPICPATTLQGGHAGILAHLDVVHPGHDYTEEDL